MTTLTVSGVVTQSRIPAGTTKIMCNSRNASFNNVDFTGIVNLALADLVIFKNCTNLPVGIQAQSIEMHNCTNIDSALSCRKITVEKCADLQSLNLASSDRLLHVDVSGCPEFSGITPPSPAQPRFSYYVENCPKFKQVENLTCYSLVVRKCGLENISNTNHIGKLEISYCKNLKEISIKGCDKIEMTRNTFVGCNANSPVTLSANAIELRDNKKLNHVILNVASSVFVNGKTTNLKIQDTVNVDTIKIVAPSLLHLDIDLKNKHLEQITIEAPKLRSLTAPKLSASYLYLDVGETNVDINTDRLRYFRYSGKDNGNLLNVSSANKNAVVVKRSAGNPLFFRDGDSTGANYVREFPEFYYKGKIKRKIDLFLAA